MRYINEAQGYIKLAKRATVSKMFIYIRKQQRTFVYVSECLWSGGVLDVSFGRVGTEFQVVDVEKVAAAEQPVLAVTVHTVAAAVDFVAPPALGGG